MQRITLIAGIILVSLSASQWLMGQSRQRHEPRAKEYVEDFRIRPDLGIDYSRVVKFKLGSRKSKYRIGEMISIDLAIINNSDQPVFLHNLSRPLMELKAYDERGAEVSVDDYTTALEATSPRAYQLIEPSHLMFTSFELLAGCTEIRAFLEQMKKLDSEQFGRGEGAYFKELFDRDMFVNWGHACFAVKNPGKYVITAEQSNDTVLVSPDKRKVKTAIGRFRSTPLTITITD